MTNAKFRRLKIGDRVTLAVACPDYTCGHNTWDGRVYIPVGSKGTIGAILVPSVYGNRIFHCVDFPKETPLQDYRGRAATHWDSTSGYRCAVYPDEITP